MGPDIQGNSKRMIHFHMFTTCEFFLWWYVKDTVYRPPLPPEHQELRQLIITAVTAIEEDLLEKVWQ
jgi:hypothetical protein